MGRCFICDESGRNQSENKLVQKLPSEKNVKKKRKSLKKRRTRFISGFTCKL